MSGYPAATLGGAASTRPAPHTLLARAGERPQGRQPRRLHADVRCGLPTPPSVGAPLRVVFMVDDASSWRARNLSAGGQSGCAGCLSADLRPRLTTWWAAQMAPRSRAVRIWNWYDQQQYFTIANCTPRSAVPNDQVTTAITIYLKTISKSAKTICGRPAKPSVSRENDLKS